MVAAKPRAQRARFLIVAVLVPYALVLASVALSFGLAVATGDAFSFAPVVAAGVLYVLGALIPLTENRSMVALTAPGVPGSAVVKDDRSLIAATWALTVVTGWLVGTAASSSSILADGVSLVRANDQAAQAFVDSAVRVNPGLCAPWTALPDRYEPWPPYRHLSSTSCRKMPWLVTRVGRCGGGFGVPPPLRGMRIAIVDYVLDSTYCRRSGHNDDYDDSIDMSSAHEEGVDLGEPSDDDHDVSTRRRHRHTYCIACGRRRLTNDTAAVLQLQARVNTSLVAGTIALSRQSLQPPPDTLFVLSLVDPDRLTHVDSPYGAPWSAAGIGNVTGMLLRFGDAAPSGGRPFAVASAAVHDYSPNAAEAFDVATQLGIAAGAAVVVMTVLVVVFQVLLPTRCLSDLCGTAGEDGAGTGDAENPARETLLGPGDTDDTAWKVPPPPG